MPYFIEEKNFLFKEHILDFSYLISLIIHFFGIHIFHYENLKLDPDHNR